MAKLGDRACAQAELHGVAIGDGFRGEEKQPRHHVADVFKFKLEGFAHAHGALNPVFGTQMQVAYAFGFREENFGVNVVHNVLIMG